MASRVLVSNYQLGVTKLWMQVVQKKHVSRMTQLNMWLKYFFFFFFAKYALQLVTYFLYKVGAGFIWHFDLFMFKSLKNFFNMKELTIQNIDERPQFIARYYRQRRPYSTIFRAKSLIADSYNLTHLKSVKAIQKIDLLIRKITEKKLRKKAIAVSFSSRYKKIKIKTLKIKRVFILKRIVKKIKKKLKNQRKQRKLLKKLKYWKKVKKKTFYKVWKEKSIAAFSKKRKIKRNGRKKKIISNLLTDLKILRKKSKLILQKIYYKRKLKINKNRKKRYKILINWFLQYSKKLKKNSFLKFIDKKKLKLLNKEKLAILKKRRLAAILARLRAKKFKKQLIRLLLLAVVNKFIQKKNKNINSFLKQYLKQINIRVRWLRGDKKRFKKITFWKKCFKNFIRKNLIKSSFVPLDHFKKKKIFKMKLIFLLMKLLRLCGLSYNPKIYLYLNKKINTLKKRKKKLSKVRWQLKLYESLIYFQKLVREGNQKKLASEFKKLKKLKKQFFGHKKFTKKKSINNLQKKKLTNFIRKFLNKFIKKKLQGLKKTLFTSRVPSKQNAVLARKKNYNKFNIMLLRHRRKQKINYLKLIRTNKKKCVKISSILMKKKSFFTQIFKQKYRIDNPIKEYLWRYRLKVEKNFIKSFVLQRRRKWLAHKNFKLFMTLELIGIFRSFLEVNYFYYNQKIGNSTLLIQIKRMWEWGRRNINYSQNEFYHILRLLYLFRLSFRFNDFFYFLHYFAYFFENKKRKKDQVILGLYRVILKKLRLPGVRLQGLHFTMSGKFNRKPRARTVTIKKGPIIPFQQMDLKVQYCARIVMTNFGLYYMRLWLYYYNL